MSARLSPDGMYYWDGQAWRSTLSPDGRFRWDGKAWTPVSATAATPYGFGPPRREPTSWTKPLQYAVAGWYVWSILYTLATPFWVGGMMGTILNQTFQRQQQVNPEVSPPPVAFINMVQNMATFTTWVSAVVYSAVFVVIIIGAWKRWAWMYYVVLVLLGLTTILVPADLVSLFVGPSMAQVTGFSMPSWLYPVAFVSGLPAIALFVWMLIALIKRGPWAMRRPAGS